MFLVISAWSQQSPGTRWVALQRTSQIEYLARRQLPRQATEWKALRNPIEHINQSSSTVTYMINAKIDVGPLPTVLIHF